MNRGVLLIAALVFLSACATVGREIKTEQLAELKKGETTVEQVVAKLGPPTSTSMNASGQRTLSYFFAHAQARPASFIPIVGAFAGGADSRSAVVVFIFGPDGKMMDYHASESSFGSGYGLAAGNYHAQPGSADQPAEAK